MAKFEDLIEETLLKIEGYSGDQDTFYALTTAMTASSNTFSVGGAAYPDGSGLSAGLVEIGTELVYIQSFNKSTGVATGVVRGFRGSTPAAHDIGSGVRGNPKFPRYDIGRSVNDAIQGLYPDVFARQSYELTPQGGRTQYDLPASTLKVFSVQTQSLNSSFGWIDVQDWSFDSTGGSGSATGKTLNIGSFNVGRPLQAVIAAQPATLTYGQDFSLTGLPDWARELVVLGATYRAINYVDAARFGANTVAQGVNNQTVQFGSGMNLGKYFVQLYDKQLQHDKQRLSQLYPPTKRWRR